MSRSEPRWLSLPFVLAIHQMQLDRFGGAVGVCDQALLESALARPLQRFHYGDNPGIPQLAAANAFGIARNHPFIDGNKRTAFVAAAVFMEDNGWMLELDQVDVVLKILALAAGELIEQDLSAWLESGSQR
jgi:death-on-curing protein